MWGPARERRKVCSATCTHWATARAVAWPMARCVRERETFIGSTLSFGSETGGSKEPLGPNTSNFQSSPRIFICRTQPLPGTAEAIALGPFFPAIADEQCTPGFAPFF